MDKALCTVVSLTPKDESFLYDVTNLKIGSTKTPRFNCQTVIKIYVELVLINSPTGC